MKSKTIKLFLFTFLMCLGGLGAWAQTKINLYSTDFETGESSDYWKVGNGTLLTPTYTGTTGRCATIQQSKDRGDYFLTPSDYGDLESYSIEFDFLLAKGSKSAELVVMSESAMDSWHYNYGYKWKDTKTQVHNPYLLYISIPGNSTTATFNESELTYTFTEKTWYHFKLNVDVVNAKIGFVILPYGETNSVLEGEYILKDGESPYCRGFFERNNRYNYSPGAICIDNVDIYAIVNEDVAQTPLVELTGVNSSSRIYTIKVAEGETLYYKLPGADEYLSTTTSPFELTIETSGTLYTYTTKGTAKSEVVETIVDATEVVLATPQISLQSYNVTAEGTLTDVKFIINNPDNSEVECTPTTERLEYTFTPQGGTESERIGISDGYLFEPSVVGMLKVYASTTGYTESVLEMPVSNYYIKNFTYNYDEVTADLFTGDNWISVTSGWWDGAEVYRSTSEKSTTLGRFRFYNNKVTDIVLGWGIGRSGNQCSFQLRNSKKGEINILDIHTNTDGTDKTPLTQMTFLGTTGTGKDTDLYPESYLAKLNTAKCLNVYEPSVSFEIKDVFIGALNTEGTDVIAEDFESVDALDAAWSIGGVNSITIGEVDLVESPNVGEAPSGVPTYVSSKTFKGHIRQGTSTGERYADYDLGGTVSNGKLMFSGDFFASGDMTGPIFLRFVDDEGNNVFKLGFKDGDGYQYFRYTVGNGEAVNTQGRSDYRTYNGFGIHDMTIDLASGDVAFTLDHINRYGVRAQTPITFNIGTGKRIAKMQIGKPAKSSTDLYFYLDNVKLYTIGYASGLFDYTIVAKCEGVEVATISSGSSKGGKMQSIEVLPLVVKNEGTFYTLDDENISTYCMRSFQMEYANVTKEVNYKHSPEVVFFGEWEEKATKTGGSFNRIELNTFSSGIGYSLQQNATPTMSVTFSVAEDGIYSITMPYYNLNHKSRGHSIQLDGTELENKSVAAYTGGTFTTEQYLTAGEHTMGVQITYSLTSAFDYLLVKRNSLPVTITAAGVGTLCSPYNLDFTNAENIAAYKAGASDGRINLTRVYNVAAREGVLIRSLSGGAVTEDIPVSATAFDANEGNEFIGTLVDIASQPSEDEEYRYYILSSKTVNGNKVYGFYLANNKKIGAGKAYLRVPLAAAAKYSFFSFDDETTGIEDVELGITETDSPVYDLFGRKVVNPATGLYIKNGKKFIVK